MSYLKKDSLKSSERINEDTFEQQEEKCLCVDVDVEHMMKPSVVMSH